MMGSKGCLSIFSLLLFDVLPSLASASLLLIITCFASVTCLNWMDFSFYVWDLNFYLE